MRRHIHRLSGILAASVVATTSLTAQRQPVRTSSGLVEGEVLESGIAAYRGIPYAAPPIGPLRWTAPQPAATWSGVRKSVDFGARCMQGRVFPDMVFRDHGPNEDCLTLNVWTPPTATLANAPVMVWIYGGGFAAGSSSEPRQDGENLAKKGVVVVSMNYRLNIFGFLVHEELSRESGRNSSGNYGLMDQVAALRWVRENIAGFGGDPANVTIFGESAGSFSVSALMASPKARGLFHRAIGESGAFMAGSALALKTLTESEAADRRFADSLGTPTLAALRAMPAEKLIQGAMKAGGVRFWPNVDGDVLTEQVVSTFAAGRQAHVPLLAGWNGREGGANGKPTAASFAADARKQFGEKADELLKLYPASNDDEALASQVDLSGDRFIALSTWLWIESHLATGNSPVYRYRFDQAPPPGDRGAYHSAEIEFVFQALASKPLAWRDVDRSVSDLMSSYWVNFAKTGNPNGAGLPPWPAFRPDGQVMRFFNGAAAVPEEHRARYDFLQRAIMP